MHSQMHLVLENMPFVQPAAGGPSQKSVWAKVDVGRGRRRVAIGRSVVGRSDGSDDASGVLRRAVVVARRAKRWVVMALVCSYLRSVECYLK